MSLLTVTHRALALLYTDTQWSPHMTCHRPTWYNQWCSHVYSGFACKVEIQIQSCDINLLPWWEYTHFLPLIPLALDGLVTMTWVKCVHAAMVNFMKRYDQFQAFSYLISLVVRSGSTASRSTSQYFDPMLPMQDPELLMKFIWFVRQNNTYY